MLNRRHFLLPDALTGLSLPAEISKEMEQFLRPGDFFKRQYKTGYTRLINI